MPLAVRRRRPARPGSVSAGPVPTRRRSWFRTVVRVLVQVSERVPPRLPVFRHVRIAPSVRLSGRQPRVDHLDQGDLQRLVALAGELVEQGGGGRPLGLGEESGACGRTGPSGDQVGRDRVPVPGLAEHLEAGKPAGRAAGHCSRRRIAASSPMPPTIVTSSGASRGGPISRL